MVTIQPTTTGINPMEFIIPALDNCVNLGRSYFTMELRLKKSTNDDLVANELLWPVNNLAHSIIKQIDLQLNGTLISPQSDTYHYKAYLENLLNYDREDGREDGKTHILLCVLPSLNKGFTYLLTAGSIKWISHPNGRLITQTLPRLIMTTGISAPITKVIGVYPSLGSVSHGQSVGTRGGNQDEISFQQP